MKKLISLLIFSTLAYFSCSDKDQKLFTKIESAQSGVHFNNRITETDSFNILTSEYIFNGGGVAVGDFNNDGKPDLFFSGNQVSNKLYLNQGNFKFIDVSIEAGIESPNTWNTGIALADINNDGLLDIYVCSAMLDTEGAKNNLLFINQGTTSQNVPIFKEMAQDYGIKEAGNSMGATFFDYDKDGFLDLYVLNNVDVNVLPGNYRAKITDGTALSNDKLYKNNGDGSFTDVTLEAGINIEGYGLGLAIADLNYDGWPDIYVSNDYLTNDILYINNQNGTFTNHIKDYVKHQSKFSMGNDIADYNNDGFLDIITLDMLGETNQRLKTTLSSHSYTSYILNEKFDYEYQYTRNMLQKGNGPGIPYSEVGLMAGVAKTDWSWSPLFVDMNNDGHKDLLITNGFPRDITDLDFRDFRFNVSRYLSPGQILDSIPTIKIPNYAFRNNGNGTFENVSEDWGLDIPSFSNGAAFADLDGDGDLDYVVNNINGEAFIFKNNTNPLENNTHNFLTVDLVGPKDKSFKAGAKVVIRFEDGSFQFQEHRTYRGYMSTVEDYVHFGLGQEKKVAALEILWPDGTYQKFTDIAGNQKFKAVYGNGSFFEPTHLEFPFVPMKGQPMFKEVSKEIGTDFEHQEKDFVDFNVQRILPHKLSQNGPCLAAGDINGDGLEDFLVGSSAGFSPQLFIQTEEGKFQQKPLFSDKENMSYEEESIVFFDLDNDGDLDLYLVSGSNEFQKESRFYMDRLFINNGFGTYSIAMDKLPLINSSGSTVQACDYDKDGFTDLFVGGRSPVGEYPFPDKSYLLKNKDGILYDVTDGVAPDLRNIGMVTDATWADIDADGFDDLIVVGELMPITIFKNTGDSLKKFKETGVDHLLGWWESILKTDIDQDGDIDLIIGNIGTNNIYQPSQERPVTLIAKDFDGNGTVDPVMFSYFKYSFDAPTFRSYPVHFWGDLYGQSPMFRAKYNSFKAYAKATLDDIFTREELEGSQQWLVNYDKSIVLENLGNGTFDYRPLPMEVQMAPISGIIAYEAEDIGHESLLLVGNDFGNEIFVGRYDAFNGALLKNDKLGNYTFLPSHKSGFIVSGDAKDIITVQSNHKGNPYIVVSQNNGKLLTFKKMHR